MSARSLACSSAVCLDDNFFFGRTLTKVSCGVTRYFCAKRRGLDDFDLDANVSVLVEERTVTSLLNLNACY